MSSVACNEMGPVHEATEQLQKMSERKEIREAAIEALHLKHKENTLHHFTEAHKEKHISQWRVTKYAEEKTSYGNNYFFKVSIGDDLYIHIRAHRQVHHAIYDFYSLHETIKHNVATCIFTEQDPLEYFNA